MQDREEQLLDALVQASFGVVGVVSAVAAALELSLTQLRVLAILRDHDPTMSELAGYLGLDRSSVTGLVDRATRRGLVARVSDANDGRSRRLALTAEGRALAARGAEEVAAGIAPFVAGLSASERTSLAGLLVRIVRHP
jgi:DNA-binding MarR family transcriptional regulator